MKKIISMISAVLVMLAFSSPITSIAKSAEFFTIGTGGPTGVYFQTGNAICKMLHKSAISADHGRKKGTAKAYRCTAPSTGGSNYNSIDDDMIKKYAPNVVEGVSKLSNWAKNL